MSSFWSEFEKTLETHFPEMLAHMRPAATLEQIEQAEQTMGVKLPEDLRQAYLWRDGCVDGQLRYDELGPVLFEPFCSWCSLDAMVANWHKDLRSRDADMDESPYFYTDDETSWEDLEIRPWVSFPATWLCVGYSGTRSRAFVDLTPGPRGTLGQLVYSDGEGSTRVLGPSVQAYLQTRCAILKTGKARYVDGWLINVDTGRPFVVS